MLKGHLRSNLYSLLTALLLSVVLICCKWNYQNKTNPIKAISWDVYGYYLYLPSAIIYHDPGLENMEWVQRTIHEYKPSPAIYQFSPGKKNRQVNTYPMGLAVAYAPGFMVAHAIAKLSSYPADGFSPPYQWSLVFTSIVFFCLGIFLLRTLLLHFFPDILSACLLILIVWGTNFFFHAGLEGTMPHNFMFVFNCLLLLFTIRWYETFRLRYAILLAFFLGLATIARPTELIWLLVPLCWGVYDAASFRNRLTLLRTHYKQVIVFGITLILTGMPQLAYWKWASGNWFVFNHGERFAFLDPYTYDFLFSYKKGWLVYTPIMIFALLGFYHLYKYKKDLFYPFFIFTVVNIYVLSSWDCWWYATSFGQRPLVESYPLLAIPLGYFIIRIWKTGWLFRIPVLLFLLALAVLNLFQTWQMAVGVMDGERMTKAYYWKIFGKKMASAEDRKNLLEIDRNAFHGVFEGNEDDFYKKVVFFRDYEHNYPDTDPHYMTDTIHFEGKRCLKLDTLNSFAQGMTERYCDLTNKSYVWIRMTVDVFPFVDGAESHSGFVASVESDGRVMDYIGYGVEESKAKPGQWNTITYDYLTPFIHHKEDKVGLYYWNSGKKPVFIDNMKFEVWEPKREP
jgi:hypothetical protein